jgi:hypothetical protein
MTKNENLKNIISDGQWTAYQSWSQCSVSCGSAGYTTRRRFCGQPAPEDGGLDCLGDSTETKDCR